MRWEEPHHPGPGLQLERHSRTQSPTLQHDVPMQPHLQAGAVRPDTRVFDTTVEAIFELEEEK